MNKKTTENLYNQWAETYDSAANKTRDSEAAALREILAGFSFEAGLELGCGTGKNTDFLAQKCKTLTAFDFSEEMMRLAREKCRQKNISFQRQDLTADWQVPDEVFDLLSVSLVLEHIRDLAHIFREAGRVLRPAGLFYLGEYHPFKQYLGKKARFETGEGLTEIPAFVHHISEFTDAAAKSGFRLEILKEYFDAGKSDSEPRILALLFRR